MKCQSLTITTSLPPKTKKLNSRMWQVIWRRSNLLLAAAVSLPVLRTTTAVTLTAELLYGRTLLGWLSVEDGGYKSTASGYGCRSQFECELWRPRLLYTLHYTPPTSVSQSGQRRTIRGTRDKPDTLHFGTWGFGLLCPLLFYQFYEQQQNKT